MKTQQQLTRILKQVQNTNRQISKTYQHKHSATLKVQTVLGIQNSIEQDNQSPSELNSPSNIASPPLISLSQQQILYYACKYFVIYNLSTREYQIISKDIKNCRLSHVKKFDTSFSDRKLIVCVYQTENTLENTFLGLLTVKTDYESRTSKSEDRYQWRVVRLCQQAVVVEDFAYSSKRNFLYFVITKTASNLKCYMNNNYISEQVDKPSQLFLVYDLTKEITQIHQQIRSSTVGFFINFITLQDANTLYLAGRNYFRQWTINYNQKSIKESNVRNLERVLKGKCIVDVQEVQRYGIREQQTHIQEIPFLNPHLQHNTTILTQPSKLIIVLTTRNLLLIKNNELICQISPETNISHQSKAKDNIQKQLQNSSQQIHKMRFLFDQYEQVRSRENKVNHTKSKSSNDQVIQKEKQSGVTFTAISRPWKTQNNNYYIAIANSNYTVFIYELNNYQTKLYTEFNCSTHQNINLSIINLIPAQSGDILLCINQNNQIHLINQQNYDPEDQTPIKSLWGNGQMHSGLIYAITSPMIQNVMCTVGEDNVFKLWSMKRNQRSILFESKPHESRPLGITLHPGGTMMAVNFQQQVKLFSILPKEFYEISSIKTNYCPFQLKYSHRGEYLVSNQGFVLIFYQPFSLKTLGYIEPVDIKFKIIDFKLSRDSSYICFLTEDNACFLQSVDVGDLAKWENFLPAHRQVEAYTAFCFEFIQRGKGSLDDKKVRNLFVGATKNKYLILYQQLGSKLIAQFPIVDCYIVDIEIHNELMFVATSKGSIRVYSWPILEQQLQLQIVNLQQGKIRYKPPRYQEYQVWHQSILITMIHKLNFSTEIIVANDRGNLAVVSFQQTKNKQPIYEQVSGERKKMELLINQMFYIKKSETQKRNKLIQKTENDILKVENEILREKISLERKMQQQQITVTKSYDIKNSMQETEKQEYIQKETLQISLLKQQIETKKSTLQELKIFITQDYQQKKLYEQGRNQTVYKEIKSIILQHKDRIKRKVQTHKEDIRNKKKDYVIKVKNVQEQFDKEILDIYTRKMQQTDNVKVNAQLNENRQQKNIQKQMSRTKSDSVLLITNILNQNITNNSTVYETDNDNIRDLLSKLQSIENNNIPTLNKQNSTSQQHLGNIAQPLFNPQQQLFHSAQQPHHPTQQSLLNPHQGTKISIPEPTQNLFIQSSSTNLNQPTQTKLKRSGKYQINEKAFLRRKQKQYQQQKITQNQQKEQTRHKLMQEQFSNQIIQQMASKENQSIIIQSFRVQQMLQANKQLQRQIFSLQRKVEQMQSQDYQLQKDFQTNLEEYNLSRFHNLTMHCQVLKMQNQLVERKQVLDNKQEIVMLAYQQKQKLQNYKQLVKGSLSKLQQKKQTMRELFSKKQTDLNLIFTQLVNEIHKMQDKKQTLQKMQRKIKQDHKELYIKETQLNDVISQLKQVKKYLLLEKMNDQKIQKSNYHHEESLIQIINFLKKRLFMDSMKEKKNKQLKKSSLNQVLKQNKNLLEQCNQLRSEGIEFENQIRNLSNKLKDAKKMISIQTKLNSQNHNVHQQQNQLQVMKKLFKMHLEKFNEEQEQEDQVQGQSNEGQVHFDAEQSRIKAQKMKTKIIIKPNNVQRPNKLHSFSSEEQDQGYKDYKPFKLSKYIEAQPSDKIDI